MWLMEWNCKKFHFKDKPAHNYLFSTIQKHNQNFQTRFYLLSLGIEQVKSILSDSVNQGFCVLCCLAKSTKMQTAPIGQQTSQENCQTPLRQLKSDSCLLQVSKPDQTACRLPDWQSVSEDYSWLSSTVANYRQQLNYSRLVDYGHTKANYNLTIV